MSETKVRSGVVARMCEWLARPGPLARRLDALARWLVPMPGRELAFADPGVAAAARLRGERGPRSLADAAAPIQMATGPNLDPTFHGTAPTKEKKPAEGPGTPGTWSWWDRPWDWFWIGGDDHRRAKDRYDRTHPKDLSANSACADPKYKGMHGAPCKYHGGTDTKCPTGTISGWFWSYDVPAIGRVYYVDCCGASITHKVFCNWSAEDNWCLGWGRAANAVPPRYEYTFTLAILDADMKTQETPPGSGKYEVIGVDP